MPKQSKPTSISKYKSLWKCVKNFEKVFQETQAELASCKREHQRFESKIRENIQENNYLSARLSELTNTLPEYIETEEDSKHKHSEKVVSNYESRIALLEKENASLCAVLTALKRTIHNLETELRSYKEFVLKPTSNNEESRNYDDAIKLLEDSLKLKTTELDRQIQLTEKLISDKSKLRDQIMSQQKEIQAQNLQLAEHLNCKRMQEQLKFQLEAKEASLKRSLEAVADHAAREREAHLKVQEVISLAEEAIKEKEELAERECALKLECKQLAATVGSIMDEATGKVDEDYKTMRNEIRKKEAHFEEEKREYENEINDMRKDIAVLELKAKHLTNHFNDATCEIEMLKKDKEEITKLLEEATLKLEEYEIFVKNSLDAVKREKENEDKMEEFLRTKKKLQAKYASTLREATEVFRNQIVDLQKENGNLKAQIEVLKLQIASIQVIGDC